MRSLLGIQQEEQIKRESECPPVLISRALFGAVDSDALTFGSLRLSARFWFVTSNVPAATWTSFVVSV